MANIEWPPPEYERDENGRHVMQSPDNVFKRCENCGAAFFPEINIMKPGKNYRNNNRLCQECINKEDKE